MTGNEGQAGGTGKRPPPGVGGMLAPEKCPHLTPGIHKYVVLRGRRDLANVV